MSGRACMILAAGFGTRMGPLTADRPKPLIEVAGRPLIDHALCAAQGAATVVVNGHYRADQLRAHLQAHHPGVLFIEETPTILDSGGAIKNALVHLGPDPILTLNADAVWQGPSPSETLAEAWRPQDMDALMLLVPRARAIGRRGGGDVAMDAAGRLRWDRTETAFVYTGAQILKTERIAQHPQAVFSLRDIWQEMIREGRLHGVVYSGQWADVGHPQGLADAEDMVRNAV